MSCVYILYIRSSQYLVDQHHLIPVLFFSLPFFPPVFVICIFGNASPWKYMYSVVYYQVTTQPHG